MVLCLLTADPHKHGQSLTVSSPEESAPCLWPSESPTRELRILGNPVATASGLSPSSLDPTPASSSAPSVHQETVTDSCRMEVPATEVQTGWSDHTDADDAVTAEE